MARFKVLIADDHASLLARIAGILEAEYDVVAAVSNGLAAVDAASVFHPDVVILDISMPIMSGLDAAAQLADGGSASKIILLSVHEGPEFVEAARNAGAHGYVVKRMMTADLLPAVRNVLRGHTAFPVLSKTA
jgi:DNA-binding NarL/FixJ family response regulator